MANTPTSIRTNSSGALLRSAAGWAGLLLLAVIVGWMAARTWSSHRTPPLSANELAGAELALGFERILAAESVASPAPVAPAPSVTTTTEIFSALPYEWPTRPSEELDVSANVLGEAGLAFLREGHRASLERLPDDEAALREAEASGDREAIGLAQQRLANALDHAAQLYDRIEVKKHARR